MKMITAFEEIFSTTNNPPNAPFKDYEQILQALKHDANVAATAFTRGAKKEFKDLLTQKAKSGFSMKEASECLGLLPFWVCTGSVAIHTTHQAQWLGYILSDLVHGFVDTLVLQAHDQPIVLVDPLHTKLVQLEEDVYQFHLRQKWTITGSFKETK